MNNSQIIKDLFRSKNPYAIIKSIKSLDYQTSLKKISQISTHPLVKSLLFGATVLPKTKLKLGALKHTNDLGNIEGELAWTITSISKFVSQINEFVIKEKEFESKLLLGEYSECSLILEDIENRICVSLWSLENTFSLKQKQFGNEENWKYLQKVISELKTVNAMFFSHFFSKKAENGNTVFQYKKELEQTLNDIGESEYEYIFFKLGYMLKNNFKHYPSFLNLENSFSIIDKYILLTEVLAELSNHEENYVLIREVMATLKSYGINDKRLDRINEIIFASSNKLKDFNFDILQLFDLYSVGYYSEAINLSEKLLLKYPHSIEIYETYVKCLLELNLYFEDTNISPFVDEVLKNLFSVYKKDKDFIEARENLYKLALSFPRLKFFKQLYSLTATLSDFDLKSNINLLYFLNSENANPQIILLKRLSSSLEIDNEFITNHISIKINYCIAKNLCSELIPTKIPEFKKKLYLSRAEFYHAKSPDLNIFINNYNDPNIRSHFREENILMYYNILINLEMYTDLVNLLVNTYFENENLLSRLNTIFIIEKIISINYELENIGIELPIFFYIENAENYYLYATLDLYLNQQNINKPSLIRIKEDDSRLIFLLANVCTIEVLNNFYLIFENEDEVINERIEILKQLTEVDNKNSKKYLEEIVDIVKNQKVGKAYKTANDGKISLNFGRIREDKEFNLENNFNRFIKFKKFSEKVDLKFVDVVEILKSGFTEDNKMLPKHQDASFNSFKILFTEMLEYFLFSKEHGLDGDLSTRIRHGVLENQIRSVFSSNDLIANKGSDNKYNNISYWEIKCGEKKIEIEISNIIQNHIKEFSNSIDVLINDIVKDYIQIQSNTHTAKKKGLFNYSFPEEMLWVIYNDISEETTYEEFLNNVFEIFKIFTLNCLNQITVFFKTDVNNQIQTIIDNLHDNLKKDVISDYQIFPEINYKISKTKNQIENELYEISKWFKLNKSSLNNLDIETVVHVAIDSINVFNAEKITPSLDLKVNNLINKGFFYIDIFKILLQNIIKHSTDCIENLDIKISVTNEVTDSHYDEFDKISTMLIVVTNLLSHLDNIDAIYDNLNKIKDNWNTDLELVNIEGGSGFQKIERIFRYDLKVFESAFDFLIEQNKLSISLKVINPYNEK